MQIRYILLLFMLLGIFLPITGSLLDISTYHFPIILVISITSWILFTYPSRNIFLSKDLVRFLSALLIFLSIQSVTGRGFVILSGGGYVIIIAAFFYMIFCQANIKINDLVSLFSLVYLILIIFLLLEFLMLSLGYQPLLVKIFNSIQAPGYKNYNPADLLQKIGLFAGTQNQREIGGLNSIFLGSQIAGMVSLFALIWFGYIKSITRSITIHKIYSNNYIVIISAIFLLVTFNATVSLLVLLAIFVYGNFIKIENRLIKNIFFILLFLIFALLIVEGLLFSRITSDSFKMYDQEAEFYRVYGLVDQIKSMSRLEFYAWSFFRPVDLWLTIDLQDQLLGSGKYFFLNDKIFLSGDFGFGADVLLKCGLLWALVYIWYSLKICLRALRACRRVNLNTLSWQGLGAITGLVSLLWLASTIHYAQAFQNPGCVIFYAMNFATTIFSIRQSSLKPK